ncbi:MAG: bifunctional folylpolyglutamate synthase/dihydrofolate synthase [Candidatus Omnitrophica bacterium]|nr:bifunctional folylpolyglutamate synthase/dihydrofolate synthase [Candidatus Omnitrophota bacterium]
MKRVAKLLHALGDPQNNLTIIHVAGTKGKGSVCAYVSYILRAAGLRVGLYTSPHLHALNERIRLLVPGEKIGGDFFGQISNRDLTKIFVELQPIFDSQRNDLTWGELTFFEVLTAAALFYFSRKKADVVVLETGLGGRLDATNAVEARVNVITSIGFDHMHLLGHTLAKIAGEKAAIIKNHRSAVVVAPQKAQALRVILERCKEFSISPVVVDRNIKWRQIKQSGSGQKFEIKTFQAHYKDIKTTLLGEHQMMNAAVAVGAVEALSSFGIKIPVKAVKSGIAQARWPLRFEIVSQKPLTIIDCAHNVDSADVLVKTFQKMFPGKKAVVILGLSQDKDVRGFCRVIRPICRRLILTKADHPRAFDFTGMEVRKIFPRLQFEHCSNVRQALSNAFGNESGDSIVLITGSVFVAAQASALTRRELNRQKRVRQDTREVEMYVSVEKSR